MPWQPPLCDAFDGVGGMGVAFQIAFNLVGYVQHLNIIEFRHRLPRLLISLISIH
ncbi:hypothetical protein CRENPOLYSF2_1430002 [Crenothrix polyspora]|uniref:Uncharacterized protein n=1 Tax=Crenothrix polyspora TaxID=360316 RepID=A0A1R4H1D7_9GAMM|nr:hypothetical protein CRENPOLYSF2_1430002 [Crenothrix polyspora]